MCIKATADILPISLFAFVFVFVFCAFVCVCLIGLMGGGGGPSLSGSLADDERWQVLSLFVQGGRGGESSGGKANFPR